jgi:hypothetical protein
MRQVRRRASGWLPIQPSRYSTVLPHLFSRNLPKKYLQSSSSFCSTQRCLPVHHERRCLDAPGLQLLPCYAHIGRFQTRYARGLQGNYILTCSLSQWINKQAEENRIEPMGETKTSRRPKGPQPMQIVSSWECCSRLQNDKQTKAFRSSQENACQWTTSKSHTAQ